MENWRSYDEEAGAHEHGFHLHVHVQRELDAKVVRVGEDFLQQAAPLLADATDAIVAIFAHQLHNKGESHEDASSGLTRRDVTGGPIVAPCAFSPEMPNFNTSFKDIVC